VGFDWHVGGGFGLMAVLFSLIWIAMVVLGLVLLILGIRWLLRQGGGTSQGSGPGPRRADDPLEVLRGRYARGEIDDEEFERRRRILGG